MVLMCDVDGVVADFVSAFTREAVNAGFLTSGFGTRRCPSVSLPFETEVWARIGKRAEDWWLTVPPLLADEEAIALRELDKALDIHWVTARRPLGGGSPQTVADQTRRWLQTWYRVRAATVVCTREKWGYAARLRPFAIVEDMPFWLDQYAERRVSARLFRPALPYNEGAPGVPYRSFTEVAQALDIRLPHRVYCASQSGGL